MDAFETTLYHAVLILSGILALLFLLVNIAVLRNKRKNHHVQRKLFLTEIELLEKERTRIAQDLHDELGPLLSLTGIQVKEALDDEEEAPVLLRLAARNIDELQDRLGGIARNLLPGTLLRRGLNAALSHFFAQYQLVTPIDFTYRYEVRDDLPAHISLQLLRMIQELVLNAVKHANAGRVEVLLKQKGNKLFVSCSDDGTWNNARKAGGLGLTSLTNRVEMMGGRMHFASDKGTDYFFEIPLINP